MIYIEIMNRSNITWIYYKYRWIKIKWTIEYQQSLLIDEYFTDEKWAIISYEYLVLSLIFVFYIESHYLWYKGYSTRKWIDHGGRWREVDW